MFTYNASNTFGELRMDAESVAPPSTCERVAVNTFWNVLFSCCPARISRHCTSGRPASIITENWRVKIASSFAFTPPPKTGMLNSLPFSVIFVGVICWRFSMFRRSSLLVAVIVPLTLEPERLVPRYL